MVKKTGTNGAVQILMTEFLLKKYFKVIFWRVGTPDRISGHSLVVGVSPLPTEGVENLPPISWTWWSASIQKTKMSNIVFLISRKIGIQIIHRGLQDIPGL